MLNGEQNCWNHRVCYALRDYFISYYELFFHLGNLNARFNLNVVLFDDEKNYNSVKVNGWTSLNSNMLDKELNFIEIEKNFN